MSIDKIIRTRRTIRRYKDRRVPRKAISRILEAARWAPSSHNMQPWRFIIVEGPAKKRLVEALSLRQKNEPLLFRLILKEAVKIVENAPTTILVYKKGVYSDTIKKGGSPYRMYLQRTNVWETQSVASALQNMLLVAHSLGLGTAWLGSAVFRERQINRLFNSNDALIAIVTIGYPDEKPAPPRRKHIAEIASFIR